MNLSRFSSSRSQFNVFQVGILYVLSLCLVCRIYPQVRQTKKFYAWAIVTLTLWMFPILHALLDQSPILWIFSYIFSNSSRVSYYGCPKNIYVDFLRTSIRIFLERLKDTLGYLEISNAMTTYRFISNIIIFRYS